MKYSLRPRPLKQSDNPPPTRGRQALHMYRPKGGAAKYDSLFPNIGKGGKLGSKGQPPEEERCSDWAHISL